MRGTLLANPMSENRAAPPTAPFFKRCPRRRPSSRIQEKRCHFGRREKAAEERAAKAKAARFSPDEAMLNPLNVQTHGVPR